MLRDAVMDGAELLGHHGGYLWAVFYAQHKRRTHFALIHADGTPLAETVAHEIMDIDLLCGGSLHSLHYLGPPELPADRLALAAKATANYRQWLVEECGYIHLDGLPADTDLSATRLKLERLFVPLKAAFLTKPNDPDAKEKPGATILSIGEVLERAPHLALLAAPGGGKSTLLKRLATAYAFADRRGENLDRLPRRDWLPLFVRCRELRDRAHRPILELLHDIPRHAGMNAEECATFEESIHTALRAGEALLLVDGLDEISDEGARQVFASHLRTFLAMFPQSALVVTSREAGFRLVAGVVASVCEQAKLAPLDEGDVLSLCERWHVEVVGSNDNVRAEAKELAQAIWSNERIRQLAENPLLLTTLLVVKRWIGELPRSRAALYREAIRVLVRTWNVEGFAPLDEEETLAQLSYVACAMMAEGKQQIGRKALLKLLQNARRELEAELQFARISPQEFIERIEYRSSLLMQTGHQRLDGVLEPIYEFRHLTFQEYLAARGYAEEQYPGRDAGHSLADVLEPHFKDEGWQEVVPLAAVLAGRRAEELMKRLTKVCEPSSSEGVRKQPSKRDPHILLYQCLRDEVQITAPTLRNALQKLARRRRPLGPSLSSDTFVDGILRGKFGAVFQEVIEHGYLAGGSAFEEYIQTMKVLSLRLQFADEKRVMSDAVATSLRSAFEAGDRLGKIRAAFVCIRLGRTTVGRVERSAEKTVIHGHFQSLYDGLSRMVNSSDLPCALAASWALAWIGERRLLVSPPESNLLLSLYWLWRQLQSSDQARYAAWALATQQLLPRDTFKKDPWGDCNSFLRQAVANKDYRLRSMVRSALVVGWYRRAPWNDAELAEHLSELSEGYTDLTPTFRELLENLGKPGAKVLKQWKSKQAELATRIERFGLIDL